MRIIIAGAGDLGFHLSKLLVQEEQDIVLIDEDQSVLDYASGHLDVQTLRGSSTSPGVLDEAGIAKADLLIAVTSNQETNFATCVIGKQMGAKKTIARVSNIEYIHLRDKLNLKNVGIDDVISPESLAAKEIKRLIKQSAMTDSFEFDKGLLTLIGLTVDENCELLGKTVQETAYLNPNNNFIVVAILRDNKTIIPQGEHRFTLNDHAYFIAQPDGISRVMALAGKERLDIKEVAILGGTKLGIHTALQLSEKYNVKLIEKDKEKCFKLAEDLQDTMIINGDGRDLELLKEEGITKMDAFIAVTGNSETNIISCLAAKNAGVGKTIALVENIDYIHLSQNLGVDTLINKKLIAANFIFRHIRQGQILNLTSIHGVDAEILEIEVKEGSKILNGQLRNLKWPKTAVVGGVIRNGQGYTVRGDFEFRTNDRVVVLARPECISSIEGYFK
jgi:trk system potassium uptake protein TrkA